MKIIAAINVYNTRVKNAINADGDQPQHCKTKFKSKSKERLEEVYKHVVNRENAIKSVSSLTATYLIIDLN
jgi:hypothetical protein